MRATVAALTFAGLMAASPALAMEGVDTKALSGEAKGVIKEFFGSLKGELQAGMKAGGPVEAIDVCHLKAPSIALTVSEESGWDVGRTSLKLRNPNNAPDAWETEVLEMFQAKKAEGADPMTLVATTVVEGEDGTKNFRLMKAIPTGEVCLNCHGTDIKKEVKAKILEIYPEDEAMGYKKGDIRGAFTLEKKL